MSAMNASLRMLPEKFFLKDPISLEELHELMVQCENTFPGRFRLKKGLFGKSIVFDLYMNIKPRISVKDNVVKVSMIQQSTKVSAGGMPSIDIKATKQRIQAAKEGGLGKAFTGGPDYYNGVLDATRELLQSRM